MSDFGKCKKILRESPLDTSWFKPFASVINKQTYVHAAKTPQDFLPRNPISAACKYQANGILKNI